MLHQSFLAFVLSKIEINYHFLPLFTTLLITFTTLSFSWVLVIGKRFKLVILYICPSYRSDCGWKIN
ncbi:MAG TPA: hypothetical protein DIT52_01505 [Flavobacteriaceae bacterium]|nr:hypothetical protein [Flavobacteriaceae bacterium]